MDKKALQQTPSTHRDNGAIAHLDDTFAHCLLTIAKDRSGHGSNVGLVDCAPFPFVQLWFSTATSFDANSYETIIPNSKTKLYAASSNQHEVQDWGIIAFSQSE